MKPAQKITKMPSDEEIKQMGLNAKIHKQESTIWRNFVTNEIYEDQVRKIKQMCGSETQKAFSNLVFKGK